MALVVNELREAEFSLDDVSEYLKRSSFLDIVTEGFLTQKALDEYSYTAGSFVHDGTVFDTSVDTIKHALEYTHSRTSIVHNGFENFERGLNEEVPVFFAHVASRIGGLAVIRVAIKLGSVLAGEEFGVAETFQLGGEDFFLGDKYTATADNTISMGGVDYELPLGKVGKSLEISPTREYEGGTVLVLEAQPNSGYSFKKWEGEDTSEEDLIRIDLEHNFYIEATFKSD